MNKEIKALKALVESWERDYEESLQTEGVSRIAYIEGYIDGLKRAIEELESTEE